MTSVAMNHCFRDSSKQFVDHDGFVILGDRVECLLDHMTTKWVHGEAQSVATNRFGNLDDLLRCTMFETTLDKKISKSVYHERVRLGDNGFDNFVFLFRRAHFELLL